MPRSRSVVERTSAFGPASVRIVSLRAGMPSTRMRQSMERRAMARRYPSEGPSERPFGSNMRPAGGVPASARRAGGVRHVAPLAGEASEPAAGTAPLGAQLGAADAAFLRGGRLQRQAAEVPLN